MRNKAGKQILLSRRKVHNLRNVVLLRVFVVNRLLLDAFEETHNVRVILDERFSCLFCRQSLQLLDQ